MDFGSNSFATSRWTKSLLSGGLFVAVYLNYYSWTFDPAKENAAYRFTASKKEADIVTRTFFKDGPRLNWKREEHMVRANGLMMCNVSVPGTDIIGERDLSEKLIVTSIRFRPGSVASKSGAEIWVSDLNDGKPATDPFPADPSNAISVSAGGRSDQLYRQSEALAETFIIAKEDVAAVCGTMAVLPVPLFKPKGDALKR